MHGTAREYCRHSASVHLRAMSKLCGGKSSAAERRHFFCACPARDKQLLAKSFLFRSVPTKKLLQPIPLILGHPGELNAITELWVAGNDHSF